MRLPVVMLMLERAVIKYQMSMIDDKHCWIVLSEPEFFLAQPTIGIKNALQEGRQIPWHPRALYRGLGVHYGGQKRTLIAIYDTKS